MDKKQVCAALGMPEDATAEAVVKKCAELFEYALAADTSDKLTLAETSITSLTAAVTAATAAKAEADAKVVELSAVIEKAAAEKKSADIESALTALKDRYVPAMRPTWRALAEQVGVEQVKTLLAGSPVVAPDKKVYGHSKEPGELTPEVAELEFEKAVEAEKALGLTAADARISAMSNPANVHLLKALSPVSATTTK